MTPRTGGVFEAVIAMVIICQHPAPHPGASGCSRQGGTASPTPRTRQRGRTGADAVLPRWVLSGQPDPIPLPRAADATKPAPSKPRGAGRGVRAGRGGLPAQRKEGDEREHCLLQILT